MLVTRFFSQLERPSEAEPPRLLVPFQDEQPGEPESAALARYFAASFTIGGVSLEHRAGYTRFHATRLAIFYYSAEVERVRFE